MAFVKQSVKLAVNQLPLLRTVRLTCEHATLQATLLRAYQRLIYCADGISPTDLTREGAVDNLQRRPGLIEKAKTVG